MTRSRSLFLIIGLAIAAAGLGLWAGRALRGDAPARPALTAGTLLPAPRALDDFQLVDEQGRPATLATLRGKPSLLFFGFTQCPDVCPTTLALLAQVRKRVDLPQQRIVLVSVDPERDTPERLAAYVHAFDPGFTGLTGSTAGIEALARQLGVAAVRVPLPGDGTNYTVDHSAALLWLDRDARLAAIFTPPFMVEALAADLRALNAH